MTIADLEAAIQTPQDWDKLTKAKLRALRFKGETVSESKMTKDPKTGDLGKLVVKTRDLLSGDLLGSEETEWTYFPTGEVNLIRTTVRDGSGKVKAKRKIEHFKDRRQPRIING